MRHSVGRKKTLCFSVSLRIFETYIIAIIIWKIFAGNLILLGVLVFWVFCLFLLSQFIIISKFIKSIITIFQKHHKETSIYILQMWKLRHRKVKKLSQSLRQDFWQKWKSKQDNADLKVLHHLCRLKFVFQEFQIMSYFPLIYKYQEFLIATCKNATI